jgi:hypothetical protein
MTLAIAITLLSAPGGASTVSVAYQNAIRNYDSCIEARMLELEPSKAAIDDIFEAAKTECAGVWVDSAIVLQSDFEQTAPAPSGKSAQELAIETLADSEKSAKDRARVKILRKRAGLSNP